MDQGFTPENGPFPFVGWLHSRGPDQDKEGMYFCVISVGIFNSRGNINLIILTLVIRLFERDRRRRHRDENLIIFTIRILAQSRT